MLKLDSRVVRKAVRRALAEDLGSGDITTLAVVPEGLETRGIIHSKENGILAGVEVAREVFAVVDQRLRFCALKQDGERLSPGEVIAEVQGEARSILQGERVALNFLQRLSGIATLTARCVERVRGYPVRIVDTRKTTPGLRVLEKYAVRAGGGFNHRFGLYDAVLIKDNHLKMAGGIKEAVRRVREQVSPLLKVEVEVETLEQLDEAIEAGADVIMLDNMPVSWLREAVEKARGRGVLLEASGGITEETLEAVASTGVDFISLGVLTHSAKALDISLDLERIKG